MIKEIKYNGFTATPSDYECPDGDLVAAINLVHEDGALRPVRTPKKILSVNTGERVMYQHKTSAFNHFIVYKEDKVELLHEMYYVDMVDGVQKSRGTMTSPDYTVMRFDAVGNTLMAFTEKGIYYYLWKDGAYKLLGDHLPNLQLSFGLVGHPRLYSVSDDSKSTFDVKFDVNEKNFYTFSEWFSGHYYLSEKDKPSATSQFMAKVNKFVANETVNSGRFCMPFFVRYAVRLYDGSLVLHSSPILMNPSTKAAPVVSFGKATVKDDSTFTFSDCDIMLVAADLDWCAILNTDYVDLSDWDDIIKSVDVFISKPIYTYDQSGEIDSFYDYDNFTTKFIGRLYDSKPDGTVTSPTEDRLLGSFSSKGFLNKYSEWAYARIYAMYFSAKRTYPGGSIHLPEFSDEKMQESLSNNANFYKLCSLKLSDVTADLNRHVIDIEDDYLQSLVNREVMTDDYLTHDQLHADYSFGYNSRLNLSGIKRKPFAGMYAQSMFAFCNALYNIGYAEDYTVKITEEELRGESYPIIYTYIKENNETFIVKSNVWSLVMSDYFSAPDSNGNITEKCSRGCWLYYPNVNAYKMIITCEEFGYSMEVELTAHEFLNGAYALLDYEQVRKSDTYQPADTDVIRESDKTYPIDQPNKIYMSDVNNPFYFPLLGIYTVGTGTILGICSAAKALSQGQFGQFPLYAFTTDGVWALEVSSTGTYSARQPITRDVCINPGGIAQLDNAVVFPTDRGIMLLSGSESKCISDILVGDDSFSPIAIDSCQRISEEAGFSVAQLSYIPFLEYLRGCGIIYDYTHQRIIVYNPDVSYAYIYSMKGNAWTMMTSDIRCSVNTYPEAVAVYSDGSVVNLSKDDTNDVFLRGIKGMIFTRPFKLDAPDALKTIDTIIQRGKVNKSHVSQVLYGSRDLFNWQPVWSSKDAYLRGFHGTPYKYFSIVAMCNLDANESLYGFTVQFTPRYTNKPR